MKAILREIGTPPLITTTGALNARAGARVLIDLLANEEFADICTVTLDWEAIPPSLILDPVKFFIQHEGRYLSTTWPLEINEVFGSDNADNALLRQIIFELKNEFEVKAETVPPPVPRRN